MWHHWRKEHQNHHRHSSSGDTEPLYIDGDCDPNLQGVGAQSRVNGQEHAGEVMEVDGASLMDPCDRKRPKRGVLLPKPPTLSSEYTFVNDTLDSCCNPEQRCFAVAYKKWIDTVIGQQP